jgi:signal transduction histidine kinase
MLSNLAENASRHSPQGAHIRIGSAVVENGVLLWVQDDGPGIPESEREKVFRRFYRLEASRTTPGSGIGLSLAAAIATRHGGRITLSNAAPGLRAEIWLPIDTGGCCHWDQSC